MTTPRPKKTRYAAALLTLGVMLLPIALAAVELPIGPEGPRPPRGPILGIDACKDRDSFTILINTGADVLGNALPAGSPDPRWFVQSYPDPLGSSTLLSGVPTARASVWPTNDPTSMWIDPVAGQSALGGDYVYTLSYNLPANAYSVMISGVYAADNSVIVSDEDVSASTFIDSVYPNAFATWNTLSYSVPSTGLHTLVFDVHNRLSSGGAKTATGLNVVATISGKCRPDHELPGATACAPGTPPYFAFDLNTGVDAGGVPLAYGAQDPKWRLEQYPDQSNPILTTSGAAYSVGNAPPTWAPTSDPASAWISIQNGDGWIAAAGDYHYVTAFVLPAAAYSVSITGHYAADNSIVLNDLSAAGTTQISATSPNAFASFTPFAYAPIANGYHELDAVVRNRDSSWGERTPTGFDAVIHVKGKCRIEWPATPVDRL